MVSSQAARVLAAAHVRVLLLQPRWLMRFILAWLIQPATALEHTVWYASISSDKYVPGSCSVLIILLTAFQ